MQKGEDAVEDGEQAELVMVMKAFHRDEIKETCKGLTHTLGLLAYCALIEGEVLDLRKVMENVKTVSDEEILSEAGLTGDVAKELLGKGLEIRSGIYRDRQSLVRQKQCWYLNQTCRHVIPSFIMNASWLQVSKLRQTSDRVINSNPSLKKFSIFTQSWLHVKRCSSR